MACLGTTLLRPHLLMQSIVSRGMAYDVSESGRRAVAGRISGQYKKDPGFPQFLLQRLEVQPFPSSYILFHSRYPYFFHYGGRKDYVE